MEIIVNIDVDDLDAAATFYRDGLDLREKRRLFEGSVVEMAGASAKIHLLSKPAGRDASSDEEIHRTYRRHWTPVHLDFVVENIEASVRRAVSAGARLESGIQAFKWGRIATLGDPFGHGFCLLQFVAKGYDEVP